MQNQRTTFLGAPFEALISEIDPSADQNSRFVRDHLDDVRRGMETTGSTDAIVVRKHPGKGKYKWQLGPGQTRFQAAVALKWTVLPAREFTGNEHDWRIFVGSTDLNRKNLTSYEVATWLETVRGDRVVPVTTIAQEVALHGVKISASQIDNLLRAKKALVPPVLEAWRNQEPIAVGGEDGQFRVTDRFVFFMMGKGGNDQLEIWSRVLKGDDWQAIKISAAKAKKTKEGAKEKGGKAARTKIDITKIRGSLLSLAGLSPEAQAERGIVLAVLDLFDGRSTHLSLMGHRVITVQGKQVVVNGWSSPPRRPIPYRKEPAPPRARRPVSRTRKASKTAARR